jgi:general secretion pathway protein J
MISKPGERGLTLLEMLVVLLIAGMAIALGFQSLGQWRRANTAITQISGGVQQTLLTESWLETSLRGLIPVTEPLFSGKPDKLEGISSQPVQQHQGGTIDISWSIERLNGTLYLRLKEATTAPLDLPLPNVTNASFSYLDQDGRSHAQWPPKLGLHSQLPNVVALTLTLDDGSQHVWAATISGRRDPYFNPFEDSYE